jgi:hypothetical protein
LYQYGKNRPTAAVLKWKSFENVCNKSWRRKTQTVTHALWSIPAQWRYSKGISWFCFCSGNRLSCRNRVPISSTAKTITHENKKCCEERLTPSFIQIMTYA